MTFVPGDVLRYLPRWTHCREGVAIVQDNGVAVDTYWSSDRAVLTDEELATAERQFNVGDGPAAFLILVVGALLTIGAVWLDAALEPRWWLHLIWLPVGLALTLGGLRLAKAWLLGAEYRHAAHEGRLVK